MPLSARHEAVLHRLVEAYIASARPVSSARVRRQTPILPLSTATIRGCMVELGELGLLAQPHCSGGRVPTVAGLRTYLAGLRPRLHRADRRSLDTAACGAEGDAAAVVAELGATLAALSGLLAVVTVPSFLGRRLHEVALVALGPRRLMALFVSPRGLVQHKAVAVVDELSPEQLLQVQALLNQRLGGLPLPQLRRRVEAADWLCPGDGSIGQCAAAVAQQILPAPKLAVVARGAAALMAQPEFADICQLRRLMREVDDERALLELQARLLARTGVQVVLGQSHQPGVLGQLSCVGQTSLPQRDGARTSIGLWGPSRMNYSRLVPLVAHATDVLDRLWQQL